MVAGRSRLTESFGPRYALIAIRHGRHPGTGSRNPSSTTEMPFTGVDFDGRLASLGIVGVRTPPRAPKANTVAERIVRTIRTEFLDHLIVIDEHHLRAVLTEFADYYNRDRRHRSLGLQSPLRSRVLVRRRVVSRSVLRGLYHVYARAA